MFNNSSFGNTAAINTLNSVYGQEQLLCKVIWRLTLMTSWKHVTLSWDTMKTC